MKKEESDLVEFMLAQLGGKDAVLGQFYGARLSEMAAEKMTLADIWKEATRDGWLDHLEGMTLMQLVTSVLPSPNGQQPKASPRTRPTPEETRAQKKQIADYLRLNPWSHRNSIRDDLKMDGRVVTIRLRQMREAGGVEMRGERNSALYNLVDAQQVLAPVTRAKRAQVRKSPKRKPASKKPQLLTAAEAAELIGCNEKRMQNLRYLKRGPAYRVMTHAGRKRAVYKRTDVEAWLEEKNG